MNDKQMEALIRKIQKQCNSLPKKKAKTSTEEIPVEKDTASEIFSEMKKLPYSS